MKTRILTSIGIAAVCLPILFLSKYIIYPIALSVFGLFAVYELLRVLGHHKVHLVSVPAYLIALTFPIIAFFTDTENVLSFALALAAVLFAYLLYLFALAVFMQGKLSFSSIAEVFAAVTYVVTSFASLTVIRYMPGGIWNLSLVFLGAWGSDVFAYFTGYFLGKHKLIPGISPKKTIEGSVGALVLTTAAFALFGFLVGHFDGDIPNYPVLLVSGFVLSLVSQIGDLTASLIKREHNVKDYSNLLPGHGGIMDRFDSVLPVCTVVLIITVLFPFFTVVGA